MVAELGATVTLSVANGKNDALADFERFSRLVLGVDRKQPSITLPARLFRVGTANANDAGLDMWANFGPAVQVKHVSLSPDLAGEICGGVQAGQVIIVCRTAEADVIRTVATQLGFADRLRGVITEEDLIEWYKLGKSAKYAMTVGQNLLRAVIAEMDLEFPLSHADPFSEFFTERKYDQIVDVEAWSV